MFKISRKVSVYISLALAAVTCIGLIVAAVFMPKIVGYLVDMLSKNGETTTLTDFQQGLVLVEGYIIVALAMVGIGLLLYLLLIVRKGQVFTPRAVTLIRAISWCLLLIGGVCVAIGVFFPILFFYAFACLLFGLCIRVVKNVIEEATYIKNENDLTV